MDYLVLDISTSAQVGIEDSPYLSWACKKGAKTPEEAYSKAGLHAEYGMVCGLSAFWVKFKIKNDEVLSYEVEPAMTSTCITLEREEETLRELLRLIYGKQVIFVGQNSKKFIIPFLAKRLLSYGFKIPEQIYSAIHSGSIDIMEELACGGVSVMSLRSSAWLLGINDPRSSMRVPDFYELCNRGQTKEIEIFTETNARVAAAVFGNCVLGNLIKL